MKLDRKKLLQTLEDVGPMSREDVQCLFGVTQTCASENIAKLREGDAPTLRIAAWREPQGQGSWVPLYGVRKIDEEDVPCPVANRYSTLRMAAPIDDRIVVRRKGLNAIHVERAMARRMVLGEDLGCWAGLAA